MDVALRLYTSSPEVAVAVKRLLAAGFRPWAISALHSDNRASREFAAAMETRPPAGTVDAPSADAPLEGDLGLTTPIRGPVRGALSAALEEIGLPGDWPEGKQVVNGKILLSVQCDSREQADRADQILHETGGEEVKLPDPHQRVA